MFSSLVKDIFNTEFIIQLLFSQKNIKGEFNLMKKSYKAPLILSIVSIDVIGLYQTADTVEASLDYSILQRSTYPKVNIYIK